MNTARTVSVIPARRNILHNISGAALPKKRVAAYARVSTGDEEQKTSYASQIDFYTNYIKSNDEWEFVELYADEARSGTTTKRRDDFNRMIQDALAGKIDLIITKAVSRFARNTVDSLTAIRQLKECGVEVFFEEQNIYTMDNKGELLITIMSSLAQEESHTISENVKWGHRRNFENGKVYMAYKRFLGYEKGEDGKPQIVEKEAETVRLIYKLFLQGKTYNAIARHLTDAGLPTPGGREIWSPSAVASILKNEKYKGDAVLQKTFTVDFLTKKTKINEGEIDKFHVTGSHPAIVSPGTYDMVQTEIERRKGAGARQSGLTAFSSRIVCGECGGFYTPRTWNSTSKYRRTVWQCLNHVKGVTKCTTPHMYEETLQWAFVKAFNEVFEQKDTLLADFGAIMDTLLTTDELDREIADMKAECNIVAALADQCVNENKNAPLDQTEYALRHGALVTRYKEAQARHDEAITEKKARTARREEIARFLDGIAQRDGILTAFDETLFCETVERMKLGANLRAIVSFKSGAEIKVDVGGK